VGGEAKEIMMTTLLANSNSTTMPSRSFWMPEQASTIAPSVDGVYYFIYWICVALFVGIAVVTTVFLLKYRHREGGVEHEPAAGHSTALELTWTIIPTLVVLMMFYFGFRGYMNMAVEPPNPMEVQVTARQWTWQFAYPAGAMPVVSDDGKLHIPVNTPVRLVLQSDDVIHSMYVPAFRVKRDAVPGRYNRFWVQATSTGEFDLYCAEYCGTNHSTMLSKVVVHTAEDFAKWLKVASEWQGRLPPIEAGEGLIRSRGCVTCHSTTGQVIVGPTFKDLYGSTVPLANGQSVVADDSYIRESIRSPQAKIHAGFTPQMPTFGPESLRDVDIDAIIWYFKSKSTNYHGDLTPGKRVKQSASAPAETQDKK
jgi:cytochrome c oxidase subunit 2